VLRADDHVSFQRNHFASLALTTNKKTRAQGCVRVSSSPAPDQLAAVPTNTPLFSRDKAAKGAKAAKPHGSADPVSRRHRSLRLAKPGQKALAPLRTGEAEPFGDMACHSKAANAANIAFAIDCLAAGGGFVVSAYRGQLANLSTKTTGEHLLLG
jgi:hypothetical protein